MEDTKAELFSFQAPIIYATSALVITAAAVVIGYLYTQKLTKDVSKEAVKEDGKMTDAHRGNQTTKMSDKAKPAKSEKESSVLTGEWPTNAPPEVYAISEDAPEHLKKILEMGFPGCPVFRRMDQPNKITEISKPPAKPVPDRTLAPIPEVLAIPENAPEHLKKIMEMGFPGYPVFKRKEDMMPESQTSSLGPAAAPVPEVLAIPENAPEHLEKIMEMGFPGCPVFKRKEDTMPESQTSSLGPAAAPVPEVLAIPENAPEHLKRVMEMGFPGCPVFKRKEDMDKPTETDGTKPDIQTETLSCEGAAAPEVYTIPENCPEHLKKVLEMGFPGCPMFRRADTDQPKPEQEPTYHAAEKEVVGNVFSMFEDQFKDQIQEDLASSGGSGGDQFKCFSGAEKLLKQRTAAACPRACPRTEHCKDHCTCFKFPQGLVDQPETNLDSESDEEEEQEEEDMASNIFEIPADAPEKIKRMLEMGFPGCPMFRQTPQMEPLTRSGQVTYPGQIPLSQILGFPVNDNETVETGEFLKMAEIMKKADAIKRGKTSKIPDNPQNAKASKTTDTERKSDVLKKEIMKRAEAAKKEPKKSKVEKLESLKTTNTKTKTAGVKTKTSEYPSIVDSKEEVQSGEGEGGKLERDPVEYCSHLQSEVKRTQQKVAIQKIEEEMTSEQKEHEQDIQRTQLESIFKLMQDQEEKFGVDSLDDIQSQMKLYM